MISGEPEDGSTQGEGVGFKAHIFSESVLGFAGASFLLKVGALIFQTFIGVALARALGATGLGSYSLSMAIINLLSLPLALGFPTLSLRELSAYLAKDNKAFALGYIHRSGQIVFLTSSLVALLCVSLLLLFREHVSSLHTSILAFFLLPLIVSNSLRTGILRAFGRVIYAQIPDSLVRPLCFLVMLPLLLLKPTPDHALFLQIVATAIAFFIGKILLYRTSREVLGSCVPEYKSLYWLKLAFPFVFIGVMQMVNRQIDFVMLGIMKNHDDVGVYKAVSQGAMLVSFVLASINMVQGPRIAAYWAINDKQSLQRLVTKNARIAAFGTIMIAVVIMVMAPHLLETIFGQGFVRGAMALRILCFGQIINGLSGSVGALLNMTGHEKYTLRGMGMASMTNILLNLLLVPQYGIIGAAVASSISNSLWNILMIFFVNKVTRIRPTFTGLF
ncbi:MAG: flippase [Spirochaetales bacterium]|nr:flippase [Spirochaetales bacterium]